MNLITWLKDDTKRAAIGKRIEVYCVLLFRIFLVLAAWATWVTLTRSLLLRLPPLRGWIVPLVSTALFCTCYFLLRKFVKVFRPAHRFRSLGPAASGIAFAWVLFAGFRFFFLLAYQQIFHVSGTNDAELEHYLSQPYGWIAGMLLTFVFSPVIEELTCRGLIQRALERRYAPAVAITVAAVLFAAMHGDGWMFVPHFLGGMVYGYAVFATRSVWAGIIMHAGHNVLTTALGQWLGGNEELAKHLSPPITAAITLAFSVPLFWLGLIIWRTRRLSSSVEVRS